MIKLIILEKMEEEFQEKFCRNSESKYVRFTSNDVVLDDNFTLEELEFIVELMKKYGVKYK